MPIVPQRRACGGSEDNAPANTTHLETSLKTCYFYVSKLPLNLIRTANVFIYILFTMFVIFCPVVLFQSRDLKWFDWAAFGSANTVEGEVYANYIKSQIFTTSVSSTVHHSESPESNLESQIRSAIRYIHHYPSLSIHRLRWRSSPGANAVQLLLSHMPDWQHSEEGLRPPGGPTVCQHYQMPQNQLQKCCSGLSPCPLQFFQGIHDHWLC